MRFLTRAVALLTSAFALVAQAQDPPTAAGGAGGVYSPLGGGRAAVLSRYVPGMQATAEVTGGSVANLQLIGTGKPYLGMTMADATLDAYKGQDKFTGKPVPVRTLMVMYPNRMHVVSIEGASVNKIADLKGKRVSTGSGGSATEVMAFRVIEAAGLDKDGDLRRERLGVAESGNAIKDRKIDAFFWDGGVPPAASTAAPLAPRGGQILLREGNQAAVGLGRATGNERRDRPHPSARRRNQRGGAQAGRGADRAGRGRPEQVPRAARGLHHGGGGPDVAVPPLRRLPDRADRGAARDPRRVRAVPLFPHFPGLAALPPSRDGVGLGACGAGRRDCALPAGERRRFLRPLDPAEQLGRGVRRGTDRAGAGGDAARDRLGHAGDHPVLPALCDLRALPAGALDPQGLRDPPAHRAHVHDPGRHLRRRGRRFFVADHPVHRLRRVPAVLRRRQVLH